MKRPDLRDCNKSELAQLEKALHDVGRRELIFAAGALGNKVLRDELGSQELSHFYEGRRAIFPSSKNPYWPDR